MKGVIRIAIFTFFAVIFFSSCFSNHPKEKAGIILNENNYEPIAVMELFTSQGCSSCPPADELFNKTIQTAEKQGSNIFALAFHVDYWNRLGWKDPFSDAAFSARQSMYASKLKDGGSYTPQMIINGTTGFVGSDSRRLASEIQKALTMQAQVQFVQLQAGLKNNDSILINYSLSKLPKESIINFALLSKTETTLVKRGENSGRTLVNANVVRAFLSTQPSQKGQAALPVTVPADQLMLIAYVQNKNDFKITGAARQKVIATGKDFY